MARAWKERLEPNLKKYETEIGYGEKFLNNFVVPLDNFIFCYVIRTWQSDSPKGAPGVP